MSRSSRLLALMQSLRRRRGPIAAAVLAQELGVSLRTLYRDIATLTQQGAPIEGAAGLGYVLRPGFFLPPLMLAEEEAEAIILGLRLVSMRGDHTLGHAAQNALAKVVAVLPPPLADAAARTALLAGPSNRDQPAHLAVLRDAILAERKLALSYVDKRGTSSERVVWPVAIGFFEDTEVLAAWCEVRQDFRHFRLDRIASARKLEASLPKRHAVLLADWRASEGLQGF